MTIIKARLDDQVLTMLETPVVASGGVEEDTVFFEFDDTWTGYAKKAVFYCDKSNVYHVTVGADNTAVVPWEVLQRKGFMFFGVFGTKGSEIKTSTVARYRVENGAITIGSESQPTPNFFADIIANTAARHTHDNKTVLDGITAEKIAEWDDNAAGGVVIEGTVNDDMSEVTITTPDAWTLISEAWNSEKRPLVVLRLSDELYAYLTCVSSVDLPGQSTGMALFSLPAQRLLDSTPPYSIWMYEDGAAQILPVESLDGADGEDGATFTPSVSADGTLSWTNDKGLANPAPVNIKGPAGAAGAAGKDGYTPVRGTDYWTADDIAAIQSYIDDKIVTELSGIDALLGSGEITS